MNCCVVNNETSQPKLPATLPGFESVKRYWDRSSKCITARVLPGEYYLSNKDEIITTVLGSCISACIRDPVAGIGGMNHFMLPCGKNAGTCEHDSAAARYGGFAMEHLINDILKYGGRRERLEIKLFGGGKMLGLMADVGQRNITFVKEYLQTETLPIVAQDLGGTCSRKINYFPRSGRVMVKKLGLSQGIELTRREREYLRSLEQAPIEGEIDLF
ncbi:MAG: chemoreceptor glutamine deamidase CheD [Gammaproteobacteria bacterium]|nr:chemoreceptor glutamine deamidase CheD [Gammaproteobacteria bacterium]